MTPGHPEYGHTPGVETTTGPLGQGLGMAVGFAIAEKRMRDEFGETVCNHRTWVFAGDGCLMEGVGQEAVSLAGHLKLGHLNLLYDMNGITIDGSTELAFTEDTAAKFRALGWHVVEACGHTHQDIDEALESAKAETERPSIVMFNTVIGKGAPTKAGTSSIHGSRLGVEEARAAKAGLGLPDVPFEVSPGLLNAWREFGKRGASDHQAWKTRLTQLPKGKLNEFYRRVERLPPEGLSHKVKEAKQNWLEGQPQVATRKASQMCLEILTDQMPELIGGSADLAGSNLTTTTAAMPAYSAEKSGRYLNYGVREFAMGTVMNGLSLHGGLIPYGGTFLVFSDYMRNAIRLSALMKTKVLYVMTHDSIGLGEDGPTHQPVEHLASLRAIPGLDVFRPADAIETMEAYEAALKGNGPALLALSRQGLPAVRNKASEENLTAKGGYVLRGCEGSRDATLIATGSEVSIALQVADILSDKSVKVAVVSLPCWARFDKQSRDYRESVLGPVPRYAIEAASPFGWARYTGCEQQVFGVEDFGASASCEELYEFFGFAPETIARKVLDRLQKRKSERAA
ncbi:transketolase family protein [Roseibium sp.]|uniref:transketolase family protein n=1 Tax=Roseibium sp. TaxID=1936156 RepID=UPI00345C4EFA